MGKRISFIAVAFLMLSLMAGCQFEMQDLPFIPTSTATLIPTALPSATPTLLPKSPKTEGVIQTEITADGRTQLTDTELGITAAFPEQWLVLGFDSDFQAQLAATFTNSVPGYLFSSAQAFASVPGLRVAAMDYQNSFSDTEEVNNNIVMIYQIDETIAVTEYEALVDEAVRYMPTEVPNSAVTYQAVATNSNGVEYGKVVVSHPAETFGFPLKQVMVFIKIGDGMLTITGTALEEEYTRLEPSFQQVINSIEIVE